MLSSAVRASAVDVRDLVRMSLKGCFFGPLDFVAEAAEADCCVPALDFCIER